MGPIYYWSLGKPGKPWREWWEVEWCHGAPPVFAPAVFVPWRRVRVVWGWKWRDLGETQVFQWTCPTKIWRNMWKHNSTLPVNFATKWSWHTVKIVKRGLSVGSWSSCFSTRIGLFAPNPPKFQVQKLLVNGLGSKSGFPNSKAQHIFAKIESWNVTSFLTKTFELHAFFLLVCFRLVEFWVLIPISHF